MRAERPVVSFDIHGAKEVVLDGETGFLIPARDAGRLAEAIIELADQPRLRAAMGKRGQQLCRPRFDHLSMTRQVRAIYVDILSRTSDLSEPAVIR